MSNIDKMTANEQLFTELTPEEGSVVEGGAFFLLHTVTAIRADADPIGEDELRLRTGGKLLLKRDMGNGETANVNKFVEFTGSVTTRLIDDDPWPNPDDKIGAFTVGTTEVTKREITLRGSGSIYEVVYSVRV